MKRMLALFLVFFHFSVCAETIRPVTFQTGSVEIQTKSQKKYFKVEVALTLEQTQRGLMYRYDLSQDEGMLFLFPKQEVISMWMKNTPLPLDMIFFDKEGTIVSLIERAKPYRLDILSSVVPAYGVLEVNAGVIYMYGIKKGDKLTSSWLEYYN